MQSNLLDMLNQLLSTRSLTFPDILFKSNKYQLNHIELFCSGPQFPYVVVKSQTQLKHWGRLVRVSKTTFQKEKNCDPQKKTLRHT